MALVLADRVKDTTTTTGTGTITLSGTAPTGFQTFGAAIGNGNTTYYTIAGGSQWEVGIGTYSSTGPTLSRDTILASSNAGAAVNFSAGSKDVFVTYPAGKSIADGYGLLPVANGGTGQSSFTDGQLLIGNSSTGGLTKTTLTAGSGITVTNGTGSILIAADTSGGLDPIVAAIVFGIEGPNSTAIPIAGSVAYGTGSTYAFTAAGTTGQVLLSNGTSAPSFGGIDGGTF